MLKDRVELMEKELKKQMDVCSNLYRKVAILGEIQHQQKYSEELSKLTKIKTEIELVKNMINSGQK